MNETMIPRRAFLGAGTCAGALLLARAWSPAEAATFKVTRSSAEWRQLLGAQRFAVLRQGATERPYSSKLNGEKRRGIYACGGCSQPLFASATKFESGTGWPSFYRAMPRAIVTKTDRSLLLERTEVLCSRCGGHLGHVFRDGPRPTGLRYCMNGLALQFRPA